MAGNGNNRYTKCKMKHAILFDEVHGIHNPDAVKVTPIGYCVEVNLH